MLFYCLKTARLRIPQTLRSRGIKGMYSSCRRILTSYKSCSDGYSFRKAFTGFPTAALYDNVPVASTARTITEIPAKTNGPA